MGLSIVRLSNLKNYYLSQVRFCAKPEYHVGSNHTHKRCGQKQQQLLLLSGQRHFWKFWSIPTQSSRFLTFCNSLKSNLGKNNTSKPQKQTFKLHQNGSAVADMKVYQLLCGDDNYNSNIKIGSAVTAQDKYLIVPMYHVWLEK